MTQKDYAINQKRSCAALRVYVDVHPLRVEGVSGGGTPSGISGQAIIIFVDEKRRLMNATKAKPADDAQT